MKVIYSSLSLILTQWMCFYCSLNDQPDYVPVFSIYRADVNVTFDFNFLTQFVTCLRTPDITCEASFEVEGNEARVTYIYNYSDIQYDNNVHWKGCVILPNHITCSTMFQQSGTCLTIILDRGGQQTGQLQAECVILNNWAILDETIVNSTLCFSLHVSSERPNYFSTPLSTLKSTRPIFSSTSDVTAEVTQEQSVTVETSQTKDTNYEYDNGSSDNTLSIVLGIVLSVLILAILVGIVIFMYKRNAISLRFFKRKGDIETRQNIINLTTVTKVDTIIPTPIETFSTDDEGYLVPSHGARHKPPQPIETELGYVMQDTIPETCKALYEDVVPSETATASESNSLHSADTDYASVYDMHEYKNDDMTSAQTFADSRQNDGIAPAYSKLGEVSHDFTNPYNSMPDNYMPYNSMLNYGRVLNNDACYDGSLGPASSDTRCVSSHSLKDVNANQDKTVNIEHSGGIEMNDTYFILEEQV
ncbi:hypothetical protein Btru_043008 [Bulinus truncatus]|nr:hypothetical protein Btru_043008 [Bulinus truncatus]